VPLAHGAIGVKGKGAVAVHGILDRRLRDQNISRDQRRPDIPGHTVTLGFDPTRSSWLIGRCQCGEKAESRVEGVVEAWVTWHKAQLHRSN